MMLFLSIFAPTPYQMKWDHWKTVNTDFWKNMIQTSVVVATNPFSRHTIPRGLEMQGFDFDCNKSLRLTSKTSQSA